MLTPLPTYELPDLLPRDFQRLEQFVAQHCNARYGAGHLVFACHAAFPAILEPALLFQLWLNFKTFRTAQDRLVSVDRVAVTDVLHSPFCQITGPDRWEMHPGIRNYLLLLLQDAEWFEANNLKPIPAGRLPELAVFLRSYAEDFYYAPDAYHQAIRDAQRWAADAYENPGKLLNTIASALSEAEHKKARNETLRLGLVLERLHRQYKVRIHAPGAGAPAANLESLVNYSRVMKSFILNEDLAVHKPLLDALAPNLQTGLKTPGERSIHLPVPKEVMRAVAEVTSILKGQSDEFVRIDNPYVPYKIARDKDMFFGRGKLIKKICNNIAAQSDKNYVIYGQRRAGKTSVLHHLQAELSKNDNLLVVNIGNIADYLDLDVDMKDEMLYVLLWNILFRIQKELGKKAKSKNLPALEFRTPTDIDFYNHPAPMNLFSNTLRQLQEDKDEDMHWKDIQVVLLIDEFTYIYTLIVGGEVKNDHEKTISITGGKVPATFMYTWKAILEKGYFSVVLAAQDYYFKFREKFSNELQIIEPLRITYLDRTNAEQMIDQPIRIGGKAGETRYRGKAIDMILDLTAGSPFYIQIFCDQLVQYLNKSRQAFITEATVKIVRDILVKGADSLLDKAVFDNLLNNGDPSKDAIPSSELEHVLRQIASRTQQRQWCRESEIIPGENMQYSVWEIIKDLELREVIERSANGLSIRVGLFKDWLNENPL